MKNIKIKQLQDNNIINSNDNKELKELFDSLNNKSESSFLNDLLEQNRKKINYALLNLRVNKKLKNGLEKIAKDNNISVSKLVEGILTPIVEQYLKNQ